MISGYPKEKDEEEKKKKGKLVTIICPYENFQTSVCFTMS